MTLSKRKHGLIKKANELAVLCGVELALIIFTPNKKHIQYSSGDIDATLLRFSSTQRPAEVRTSADVCFDSFYNLPEQCSSRRLCTATEVPSTRARMAILMANQMVSRQMITLIRRVSLVTSRCPCRQASQN